MAELRDAKGRLLAQILPGETGLIFHVGGERQPQIVGTVEMRAFCEAGLEHVREVELRHAAGEVG